MTATPWRRSSYCADGSCVYWADLGDVVAMGVSKPAPETGISERARVPKAHFAAMLAGMKAGEFDGMAAL